MFNRQATRQLDEHQRRIDELESSIEPTLHLEPRIAALETTNRILDKGLHDDGRQGAFTLLGSSIVGASFLGAETVYVYQNHVATAVNLTLLVTAFALIAVSALSGAGVIVLFLWQHLLRLARWVLVVQVTSLALAVVLAAVAAAPAFG